MKFLLKNPVYGKGIDLALLLLRIAAGGFMLTHGYGKMVNLIAGNFAFADPLGLGMHVSLILTVLSEIVCAAFLLLGIVPRLVCIPLIITMLVAAFVVHAGDVFAKKELALFYLIAYLVLFILGAGKYSVQTIFKG